MVAIANCVTERFLDTASGSSEVSYLDDDDQIPRNNRCERAGAILTGNITVEYHYVDDSENEEGQDAQEFSSNLSRERETSSVFRREEAPERFAPPTSESLGTLLRMSLSGSYLPFEARPSSRGRSPAPVRMANPEAHRVSDPIPVFINALPQGRGPAPSGSIPEQLKSEDKNRARDHENCVSLDKAVKTLVQL
ncbi:hypothetical protein BWQ96_10696 [Gracilariopsis chorda]|uniref:Uncharacterized protein n=1 Tax=Gracilariopsis chorda TaxID=448386 RepID=A0A2V3IC38_9FLOR|nr:hypothetical protein BWQ96_10696 [Gracilariopsis chorda]|eukprot:PXF39608.1 hypothetical protein BWQ96_10696 [Gracilariopsis chorda]